MLTDTTGGRTQYLMAGTLLEPGQADSTDVHVVYTDDIGNIIWQKTYDTGENERCLNVVHDSTGFVMTGYVDTAGAAHQVFVLRIDGFGNVVDQSRFESPFSGLTHGLGIQHTQDNGYVLTGFIADDYATSDSKRTFVMKLDPNLNPSWSRYFNTPWVFNRDYDMGESIVEIPGQGYFVSGSMNFPRNQFASPVPNFTDQGVLAIMLDLNGNLLWNKSFAVQDSAHAGHGNVGVKPYFDTGSNLIYLMSNNTQAHQFNITVFDLAGNIVNNWDYGFVLNGIAGFDLNESANPNTLVACGVAVFFDFLYEGVWSSTNYPPVLVEFNKSDGSILWSKLYKFPSENYGFFPNGFFTPIPGEQPLIFTPDMLTLAPDGGYGIAAYRSNSSSFFDLEVIKTDQQGHSVCPYDTLDFNPLVHPRYVSDSMTVDSGFTAASVVFVPGTLPYSTPNCADPDTCICEIIPNYSVSTTDSCTYQFSDLSLLDSCFSICSWSWDFGDGTYSSVQNPTHTYDTIGWHTICLSVVVCGSPGIIDCEDLICQDLYVSCDTCVCEIDPGFSFTTSDSCTFQFMDISVVDTCYDICEWSWDFGDGGTSTNQNPSYSYSAISAGWQTVCLNVTACEIIDPASPTPLCDTIICQQVYVGCDSCLCEIDPAFSFTTSDSCTFQFTDQSLLDSCYSICSWTWDFGDGGLSTSQNPSYSYSTSSNGWQTVCLSMFACDSVGNPTCDTIICQQVYVSCDTCICEIDPAFSYATQDSCTFQFTDQSWVDTCFNICTWNWDFGDGNTSNSANPSHTYYNVGWQTVCLQVSACDSFGITGCDTIICMEVYVECDTCECEIIPGFNYTIDYDSCAVAFTDQSHMADTCFNIWAWHWDFGDGNNSSNQNPTHSYSGSGTYTVCQTIYAGAPGTVECDTTYCEEIYVNCDTCICEINPGFSYTIDQDSCIVCFEDESTVDSCVDIVGQSWTLGNPAEVGGSMPCREFTVNGTYTICITVTAMANNVQCDTTYCEDIDIHCCDTVLGISDFGPPLDVVVYPNPFSEMTTVQLSRKLKNGSLVLYDLYGRKVDEMRFQNSIGILNRNNLSDGLYSLIILEDGTVVFQGKLAIH